jgi:aryl-alcohol dehydrogenase-like predicted oxidoreductase
MSRFQKDKIGNTEQAISALRFGCTSLGNLFHAISDEEASDIQTTVWGKGYRYFDTEYDYSYEQVARYIVQRYLKNSVTRGKAKCGQ